MEDLLDLALDDPTAAEREARALLAGGPDDVTRSFACQALGIVLRDAGDLGSAARVLRRGVRAAERAGRSDRVSDIRATLAVALVLAGRENEGLAEFRRAQAGAAGALAAKIAMREAAVMSYLGRHRDAVPLLRAVVEEGELGSDPVWESRTRGWLGHSLLRLGALGAAEVEIVAALRCLGEASNTTGRMALTATLGEIAVARGDLPGGLQRFVTAVEGLEALGQPLRWGEVGDYAAAYLAAGLPSEAVGVLERYQVELSPLDEPQRLLLAVTARLASGDLEGALADARRAALLFRRQHRPWFELRARLAVVQVRDRLGDRGGLAREAASVALALHDQRADEAPGALVLAGRLARGEDQVQLWQHAASYRGDASFLAQAAAELARALLHERAGDRRATLAACRTALTALDDQRRLMGGSELRAAATTHARELTEVALRAAAHDPRLLLTWAERTRATTLAQPRVTSNAETIPESLAALRDNGKRLAEARQEGGPTEALEKERHRLERAVRAESHLHVADASDVDRPASVEDVVGGVGDGCLVEIVEVDGMLHVLVVHGGRVRRRVAGSAADARALLDPVAMLLRRTARGRPASTEAIGRRLQEAVLGDAVRLIPEGPVVLAPPPWLHGLPWALLPALADRPFSVVPSAGQWLRARKVARPDDRRTLLVAGPGLATGGAEVPLLARAHPAAMLLSGRDATLEAVLEDVDGADLVHLAAHGHFRADSPLFSSLELADGPLTVHDIERIGRAPYRVVLSACESGVLAPVGAQELLGLSAALFGLGTAGLVCSVAEVNDEATAELMVSLHAALAAGADPATALWRVRREASDPVAAATASAFLALGV